MWTDDTLPEDGSFPGLGKDASKPLPPAASKPLRSTAPDFADADSRVSFPAAQSRARLAGTLSLKQFWEVIDQQPIGSND